MRNYEVGDLIKIGRVGWDSVRKIDFDRQIVFLESGGFVSDTDITVIRKPRLGSKEARDIVAKIGWHFKNKCFELGYQPSGKGWYKSTLRAGFTLAECFYEAKAMLKEQL